MNQIATVTNLKTVSDTKRSFYNNYNKPINSVYRRIVEELLVEMHLLSVNADFKSDPIFYLGVVSCFERLMQGYQPDQDKGAIFNALCRAVDGDPESYRAQAGNLLAIAKEKSGEELIAWLGEPTAIAGAENIAETIKSIAANANFKYSRPFGIGLYTLLEEADAKLLEDSDKRNEIFENIAKTLSLPGDKMKKDLELYRSNLEKMEQVLKAIEDALQASRKQREKRAQEKKDKEEAAKAAAEQSVVAKESEESVKADAGSEGASGIELDK
ncbi:photosystem II biogenesis protein Psp29 [Xenococcus sp. PCC 7305]|uniref:photosystem II biogenesis protein Psp29 n=1 Tax=Xenococcus sp. PCC 7305 TaxID=102125 RepID=UPI0002AC53E5|nr:photosystem II biogenesis protein Psp29 [Xenococcus sp. PCC 7305]ELS01070.1 photosystem II biogenesis protein Psp29 [Xenococcus sp. PCC 7305]